MSRRCLGAGVAVALVTAVVGAAAARAECTAKPGPTTVCTSPAGTYRVIENSASPDGRFAFGWALSPDAPPDKRGLDNSSDDGLQMAEGGPDVVENVILRLADGAVLAKTRGRHFGDAQSYNHTDHKIAWSKEGSTAVEFHQRKWDTPVADAWRFPSGERAVGPFTVGEAAIAAAKQAMVRTAKQPRKLKVERYAFSVGEVPPVNDTTPGPPAIDAAGNVKLNILAQVPKEEDTEVFYFDVDLAIGSDLASSPPVRVTAIRRIAEQ